MPKLQDALLMINFLHQHVMLSEDSRPRLDIQRHKP